MPMLGTRRRVSDGRPMLACQLVVGLLTLSDGDVLSVQRKRQLFGALNYIDDSPWLLETSSLRAIASQCY